METYYLEDESTKNLCMALLQKTGSAARPTWELGRKNILHNNDCQRCNVTAEDRRQFFYRMINAGKIQREERIDEKTKHSNNCHD